MVVNWSSFGVDAIICICLADRPDRFKQASEEFDRMGIAEQVIFYRPNRPTVDEYNQFMKTNKSSLASSVTRGALGCWRSHQIVLKSAKDAGLKRVLVLEDDVEFLNTCTSDSLLQLSIDMAAHKGWDFWHLGYLPVCGSYPLDTRFRVWNMKALSTVAYVASIQGMNKIINVVNAFDKPIDVWMMNNCVQRATFPKLAWQRDSPTSVEELWFGLNVTACKEFFAKIYRQNLALIDLIILVLLPIVLLILALYLLYRLIRFIRGTLGTTLI